MQLTQVLPGRRVLAVTEPAVDREHRRGVLLVFLATVMWSLAGLFARAVPHLDFGAILFARAGFGGVCGLIVAVFDWRAGRLELKRLVSGLTKTQAEDLLDVLENQGARPEVTYSEQCGFIVRYDNLPAVDPDADTEVGE